MDRDETVFRGSRWRWVVISLGGGYIGLLVTAILMRQPLEFVLPMVAGWTLGAMIMAAVPLSMWEESYLIIRGRELEGPVRSGWFSEERRTVSLSELDLAASRYPSCWKSGYLQLADGSRILLRGTLFSAPQAADIVFEISRRQQTLAPGEPPN